MDDDLAAFLRARLDEDDAAAKAAHFRAGDHWDDGEAILFPEVFAYIARFDPARALREVEAGRKRLHRYEGALATQAGSYDAGFLAAARLAVLADAAVWSGHVDYRQEWVP